MYLRDGSAKTIFTSCHTEIEVADQTFHLTQSQYTDTGQTSPSTDRITPSAWQGSHWSANFESHWYDSTPKKSRRKRDSNPGSSAVEADALTTRPTRRSRINRSLIRNSQGVQLRAGAKQSVLIGNDCEESNPHLVVGGCLINVPATCQCISKTNLRR